MRLFKAIRRRSLDWGLECLVLEIKGPGGTVILGRFEAGGGGKTEREESVCLNRGLVDREEGLPGYFDEETSRVWVEEEEQIVWRVLP